MKLATTATKVSRFQMLRASRFAPALSNARLLLCVADGLGELKGRGRCYLCFSCNHLLSSLSQLPPVALSKSSGLQKLFGSLRPATISL
jgi:hypothetical protein